MGGTFPKQADLGCVSKVAEQARESEPLSSGPLWPLLWLLSPGPGFEPLPCLPLHMDYDISQLNASLPQTALVKVFITVTARKLG